MINMYDMNHIISVEEGNILRMMQRIYLILK